MRRSQIVVHDFIRGAVYVFDAISRLVLISGYNRVNAGMGNAVNSYLVCKLAKRKIQPFVTSDFEINFHIKNYIP